MAGYMRDPTDNLNRNMKAAVEADRTNKLVRLQTDIDNKSTRMKKEQLVKETRTQAEINNEFYTKLLTDPKLISQVFTPVLDILTEDQKKRLEYNQNLTASLDALTRQLNERLPPRALTVDDLGDDEPAALPDELPSDATVEDVSKDDPETNIRAYLNSIGIDNLFIYEDSNLFAFYDWITLRLYVVDPNGVRRYTLKEEDHDELFMQMSFNENTFTEMVQRADKVEKPSTNHRPIEILHRTEIGVHKMPRKEVIKWKEVRKPKVATRSTAQVATATPPVTTKRRLQFAQPIPTTSASAPTPVSEPVRYKKRQPKVTDRSPTRLESARGNAPTVSPVRKGHGFGTKGKAKDKPKGNKSLVLKIQAIEAGNDSRQLRHEVLDELEELYSAGAISELNYRRIFNKIVTM